MIKKGIILAGGTGSRLSPLTKVINKQLLPLYDKPLIFYPLSILMLAGIRDILIITNPNEDINFKKILGNGSSFGIKIQYLAQQKPNGLPEAFIIGEKFINKQSVALILGDNFFYGQGFTKRLKKQTRIKSGSTIFTYKVNNPQDYGIVEIKNNKIISIKEKPKKSKSDLAITGLYFFDKNAVNFTKKLKPSKRKELEIVDLIKKYLKIRKLNVEFMGRGSAWLDTGNADSLFETSQFISNIERRQGIKISCLEEIALNNKWISKSIIKKQIKFYGNCSYSRYLKKIISNNENKY
jgi:glucose-1-phosphate thymidylyltransferase